MSAPTRADLKAARDEMRGIRETRQVPIAGFELREVGTNLRFMGYASTTCADHDDDSNAYEMWDIFGSYVESVVRGAFVKTLRENADVAFLVNHEGVSMSRTKAGSLKLAEDTTGLHVDATLNPTRPDVQILRAAVEDGALDEMSMCFRVVRQEWNDAYDRRWLTELNLDRGDVSAVNMGANEHTAGLVAIRNRLFGGPSERPRAPRRAMTPVVLPDHTARACLDLARAGKPRAGKADSGSGSAASVLAAAREDIQRARRQLEESHEKSVAGLDPLAVAHVKAREEMRLMRRYGGRM